MIIKPINWKPLPMLKNNMETETDCELCQGKGFFLANSDKYGERIEKCESCSIFETDEKAKQSQDL
jgi:hypothetical protein